MITPNISTEDEDVNHKKDMLDNTTNNKAEEEEDQYSYHEDDDNEDDDEDDMSQDDSSSEYTYETDSDTDTESTTSSWSNDWKQHLKAVLISAVAALLLYPLLDHWANDETASRRYAGGRPRVVAGPPADENASKTMFVRPSFKRTADVRFCLQAGTTEVQQAGYLQQWPNGTFCTEDLPLPYDMEYNASHDEKAPRYRYHGRHMEEALERQAEDGGLRPFEFFLPTKLLPALLAYYEEEYTPQELAAAGWIHHGECVLGGEGSASQTCSSQDHLQDASTSSSAGKTNAKIKEIEKIQSVVYIQPSVESFYGLTPPEPASVNAPPPPSSNAPPPPFPIPEEEEDVDGSMQPEEPAFTGFAAKFLNLGPDPLDMYWDAPAGPPRDEDDGDDDEEDDLDLEFDEDNWESEWDEFLTEDQDKKRKKKKKKRSKKKQRKPTRPVGREHTKVATIPPFQAVGTSTFGGHQFYLTPTYDKSRAIHRFVVTPENPIVVFDPFENPPTGSGTHQYRLDKLTQEQRRSYEAQLLNLAYARDYKIATKGRAWLSMFPRPGPMHFMWRAEEFGQVHAVRSKELHFGSLPKGVMKRVVPPGEEGSGGGGGLWSSMKKTAQGSGSDGGERILTNLEHREDPNGDGVLNLTLTVKSCAPRVFEIPNFLSSVEADHILALAQQAGMEESTVSPGGEAGDSTTTEDEDEEDEYENLDDDIPRRKKHMAKSTRSSTNTWIDRFSSPIVDAIYRRAADVLGMDESTLRDRTFEMSDEEYFGSYAKRMEKTGVAESMQVVHYEVGQHYTAHHDFTFPNGRSMYQPTRFATLLLYLNGPEHDEDDHEDAEQHTDHAETSSSVLEGGETVFPKAVNMQSKNGISITPQKGKAVLFYSVLPDGNMDDLSQHASLPIRKGEKWLANLWIWDPIIN